MIIITNRIERMIMSLTYSYIFHTFFIKESKYTTSVIQKLRSYESKMSHFSPPTYHIYQNVTNVTYRPSVLQNIFKFTSKFIRSTKIK